MTAILKFYLDSFGRKRFGTIEQKRALWEAEMEYGSACVKEAIQWAARNNIRNTDSIITAARKKAKRKREEIRAPPPLPPIEDERTDEEKRLDAIWEQALQYCNQAMSKATVTKWLRDSYLESANDGAAALVLCDDGACAWCREHLKPGIVRALNQALDLQIGEDVDLRFRSAGGMEQA